MAETAEVVSLVLRDRAQAMVDVLNQLRVADHGGVLKLIEGSRVVLTEAIETVLTQDPAPFLVVQQETNMSLTLSPLGLLNSLLGPDSPVRITACYADADASMLTGFKLVPVDEVGRTGEDLAPEKP